MWAQGQTGRGAVVAVLDTGIVAGFPQLSTATGSWFDPYDAAPDAVRRELAGTARRSPRSSSRWRRTCASSPRASSATAAAARRAPCTASSSGRSIPTATRAPTTRPAWSTARGTTAGRATARPSSTATSRPCAPPASSPCSPPATPGPAPSTGASPASAPGAVAVGSVSSADVVSSFSGRGPSSCSNAIFPTIAAYGEGSRRRARRRARSSQGTSFAAPQVTGAVALLTAMFPGATPEAIIDALVRGARDVGDAGRGHRNGRRHPQRRAGRGAARRRRPRGPARERSGRAGRRTPTHLGLVLSGRAHERGGGTSDGIKASAFISMHGVPASPFPLSATPRDADFGERSRARSPGARCGA